MRVLRSILAVLAAPVVWGLVMIAGNQVLYLVFPEAASQNWSTGFLLCLLVATTVYSFVSGVVAALIAGRNARLHGIAAGLALLAVGIMEQAQYWDSIPLWYHLSFLALLVPMALLGALWVGRRAKLAAA